MQMAVDRHSFPLLPALNCGYIAPEVSRNFLPGVQPLFGLILQRRCTGKRFAWGTLLHGPTRAGKVE